MEGIQSPVRPKASSPTVADELEALAASSAAPAERKEQLRKLERKFVAGIHFLKAAELYVTLGAPDEGMRVIDLALEADPANVEFLAIRCFVRASRAGGVDDLLAALTDYSALAAADPDTAHRLTRLLRRWVRVVRAFMASGDKAPSAITQWTKLFHDALGGASGVYREHNSKWPEVESWTYFSDLFYALFPAKPQVEEKEDRTRISAEFQGLQLQIEVRRWPSAEAAFATVSAVAGKGVSSGQLGVHPSRTLETGGPGKAFEVKQIQQLGSITVEIVARAASPSPEGVELMRGWASTAVFIDSAWHRESLGFVSVDLPSPSSAGPNGELLASAAGCRVVAEMLSVEGDPVEALTTAHLLSPIPFTTFGQRTGRVGYSTALDWVGLSSDGLPVMSRVLVADGVGARVTVESASMREPLAILKTLRPAFAPRYNAVGKAEASLAELDGLVGLAAAKKHAKQLVALVRMQALRREQGLHVTGATQHLVFTGNPGTGKTTLARIIARGFRELGLVRTDTFVEADRSTLVAGYVGQTALKTQAVIDKALGGVLFIDEAYSLAGDHAVDFGFEALDTLVKAMEDHRTDLVVIVAGYPDEMKKFMEANVGLASRFAHTINFEDYSVEELVEIWDKLASERDYFTTPAGLKCVRERLAKAIATSDKGFGNARVVRNLFERSIQAQSLRIQSVRRPTALDLLLLDELDIAPIDGAGE